MFHRIFPRSVFVLCCRNTHGTWDRDKGLTALTWSRRNVSERRTPQGSNKDGAARTASAADGIFFGKSEDGCGRPDAAERAGCNDGGVNAAAAAVAGRCRATRHGRTGAPSGDVGAGAGGRVCGRATIAWAPSGEVGAGAGGFV